MVWRFFATKLETANNNGKRCPKYACIVFLPDLNSTGVIQCQATLPNGTS
jgi:hypothetical protein